MGILADRRTRVCVQGITGRIGRVQAGYMLREGTRIVSGATPGRGGQTVEGIPVFDSVVQAQEAAPADASVLFVPPAAALEACSDAVEAGIRLIVLITEGVPVHDTMRIRALVEAAGARLIGPTTPGVITPGQTKIGIMPARMFSRGPVGLISRSGTLSYEVAGELTEAGIGQSTVVGMGADPVVGTGMAELLSLFMEDPETRAVVLVGEVGGDQEERAAAYFSEHGEKPIVAYVAGQGVPQGVRMGHAGAIVSQGTGQAADKVAAFEAAGVAVARRPSDVTSLVRERLSEKG